MAPLLCTPLSEAGSEGSTQTAAASPRHRGHRAGATAGPDLPACRARFAGAQGVPAPKCAHTCEYVTLIYSPLKELRGKQHLMISKGSIIFSHLQLFWKLFRWARSSPREPKLLQPGTLRQCSACSAVSVSKHNRSNTFADT